MRPYKTFRFLLNIIALLTAPLYAKGVANLSSRPDGQPKTIDFFADALYWYTSETVDWAFVLSGNPNALESSYKTFNFNWAPGFRIGVGYNMEHDGWDTQIRYTWFESKASDETSGQVTSAFLGARLSLLEPFSTAKASLNLHYNMFDWTLGRSYFISTSLLVRPSIGLRGGWINQKIHSTWQAPNFLGFIAVTASESIKQRFQAGGPTVHAAAKWHLKTFQNHSFYLASDWGAGYLWGRWKIRDQFLDTLHTAIFIKTTDRDFGSLFLHALLGLGWDADFDHERSHFELKIGYEIEDWLNQFQIFSDGSGSQNNDLILQGLSLNLRFDF